MPEHESISFAAIRDKESGWYMKGNGSGLVHDVLHADRFQNLSKAQNLMTSKHELVSVLVNLTVTVLVE